MNIAILGLGTVGTGITKIIEGANPTAMTADLHISHIFVRPDRVDQGDKLVSDYNVILNDQSVETVVEVLGGIEPAHTMITQALKHHKNVVTANKAVVACYIEEFKQLARENNVQFRFEASVGGGIPWIVNLERGLRIDAVDSVHGIFNGTSNFILDRMTKTGESFESVLKQAQDLGYAEADPSADIDGYDIENKLCISVDVAYDTLVHPGEYLPKFGIRTVQAKDIEYFKQLGLVVKLMGRSKLNGDHFSYVIEPVLYKAGEFEASISDNFNCASFHGASVGDLGFIGQGAGMMPTGQAVVQDILDINGQVKHLKRTLDTKLKLENRFDKGNYIVRTTSTQFDSLTSDWQVTSDGEYRTVVDIDAQSMHSIMKKVLADDSEAFMARVAGGVE
ncbi:homoserine dehydrogenase (plasmid) [Nicoliella spurrieriana]|uniref:Homoserine dehydrogenase n=1 Tax=Nicoliella spurrieriana TaxID=2925830 RepID=A0A976X532_9LACO|nr:homoserine dehydrogenase [Nicoliella spurrieriana]UQS86206.1 homoserine dehydrogenase [Nicoliella spurrieriana]